MTLFARVGTVLMLAAALRLPAQQCAKPPSFSGSESVICIADETGLFAAGWLFHEGLPPATKPGDQLLFGCSERWGCLFLTIIEHPP